MDEPYAKDENFFDNPEAFEMEVPFMVERFAVAPDNLYVRPPAGTQTMILHQVKAEVDELWGFVGTKANRQRLWLALNATARQVIAFPYRRQADV